jgi:hypothetical protein
MLNLNITTSFFNILVFLNQRLFSKKTILQDFLLIFSRKLDQQQSGVGSSKARWIFHYSCSCRKEFSKNKLSICLRVNQVVLCERLKLNGKKCYESELSFSEVELNVGTTRRWLHSLIRVVFQRRCGDTACFFKRLAWGTASREWCRRTIRRWCEQFAEVILQAQLEPVKNC